VKSVIGVAKRVMEYFMAAPNPAGVSIGKGFTLCAVNARRKEDEGLSD
jgi:hypothetical protein